MRQQIQHINPDNHSVIVIENQRFNYNPSIISPYGDGWQYNEDLVMDEIKYPNGDKNYVYYATTYRVSNKMGLDELINGFIRCYYTINGELAIQRQRDTKPEEFETYNTRVEKIKTVSKEIYKKF